MSQDTILIIGRGKSIYDFDWPQDLPIMAISSGIFAVPEGRKVDHFVTLDQPKFYFEPIHDDGEGGITWIQDDSSRHWRFWLDQDIIKHTTSHRLQHMKYKSVPPEIMDELPEKWLRSFTKAILECPHALGFQPTWADYPPCKAWPLHKDDGPNFTDEGPLGLSGVLNSLFFGVQIAYRLGYRRYIFAGVDFNDEIFEPQRAVMREWYKYATECGLEWINTSPESSLAEYMPTEGVAV